MIEIYDRDKKSLRRKDFSKVTFSRWGSVTRRLETFVEIDEYLCLMNTSEFNSINKFFIQIFHLIF